jgi:hypothetical protein
LRLQPAHEVPKKFQHFVQKHEFRVKEGKLLCYRFPKCIDTKYINGSTGTGTPPLYKKLRVLPSKEDVATPFTRPSASISLT